MNYNQMMRDALIKCKYLARTIWLGQGGEEVSVEIAELQDTIDAALLDNPNWLAEKSSYLVNLEKTMQSCIFQMNDAITDEECGDDAVYLVGCMKTCIERMMAVLERR